MGRHLQGSGFHRALAWIAPLAFALGCAAIDHGYRTQEYAGVPLSPTKGRGAERFQAELQLDETLRNYVADHGNPDYFYVVDRQKLYFFYTGTDKAEMFERILTEPSTPTELGRIPGSLLKLLPEATRTEVEARRAAEQQRAQAKARRAKAKIARSSPQSSSAAASIAPGGQYVGGFEVADIVARMKAPRTAADPGVPDWKESRAHGRVAYTAKVGRAQYEVAAQRVAFSVDLPASGAELPGSARLAIERINAAIFAAKADAVTNQMMDLAERAAADRSGHTSFAQRVAGRTVRIGRHADTGMFVYSVHP